MEFAMKKLSARWLLEQDIAAKWCILLLSPGFGGIFVEEEGLT